jgi:hypothetical protein
VLGERKRHQKQSRQQVARTQIQIAFACHCIAPGTISLDRWCGLMASTAAQGLGKDRHKNLGGHDHQLDKNEKDEFGR